MEISGHPLAAREVRGGIMQYRIYITALQYGCETVEAENEEEAKQEVEKLFQQHRISWHDEELTDLTLDEVVWTE